MGTFESCVDNGVLVGYSSIRKAYKCYNTILNKVVERINVTIDKQAYQNQRKKKTNQWNRFLKKKQKMK